MPVGKFRLSHDFRRVRPFGRFAHDFQKLQERHAGAGDNKRGATELLPAVAPGHDLYAGILQIGSQSGVNAIGVGLQKPGVHAVRREQTGCGKTGFSGADDNSGASWHRTPFQMGSLI